LTGNAALAYNLPTTFFVKNRSEPNILKNYFKDEEILMFFSDPKRWALYNGGVTTRFYGLIQNDLTPSAEFYSSIDRILNKFEVEISGIRNNSPQGQW
jgi:hypothetical protein